MAGRLGQGRLVPAWGGRLVFVSMILLQYVLIQVAGPSSALHGISCIFTMV
jgi:hypothetical protein